MNFNLMRLFRRPSATPRPAWEEALAELDGKLAASKSALDHQERMYAEHLLEAVGDPERIAHSDELLEAVTRTRAELETLTKARARIVEQIAAARERELAAREAHKARDDKRKALELIRLAAEADATACRLGTQFLELAAADRELFGGKEGMSRAAIWMHLQARIAAYSFTADSAGLIQSVVPNPFGLDTLADIRDGRGLVPYVEKQVGGFTYDPADQPPPMEAA